LITANRTRFAAAIACFILASCGGSSSGVDDVISSAKASAVVRASTSDSNGKVTLPLEVLSSGGSYTVTTTVNAPSGQSATRLWMRIHNLAFDNEASVQVNDGPWIAVSNQSASIEGGGKAYGGIGGGFSTLKLSVPITSAQNGTNTVRFRFNGTDGVVSGYRVLGFNLRDASSNNLVDEGSNFQWTDPTTWKPGYPSTTDISAGEQLWRTATIVDSPLNHSTLQAHCMDCHAQDGRDLYKFNFSDNSIMQRSMFHGLNETQGKQIASYIRTLTAKYGVPGSNCRPWNPPYQPGDKLDSRPRTDWTCGAGIDSVMDNDLDSQRWIFPDGINKDAVATGKQINLREIPISFQLPDWMHWLPRIHPKDAWGDYFTNSNLNKEYAGDGGGSATYNMRSVLASGGSSYVTDPKSLFLNQLYYWGVEYGERFQPPSKGVDYLYTIDQQKRIYSTVQWQLMKSWELAQDFNLETLCPTAYRNAGAPKAESRSWCGQWRFAFDVSPHIQKFPPENSMFGSTVAHYYFANAWYELQILLNPGSGAHNVHLPVDWQYTYGLVDDLSRNSGRLEPMRNLLLVVKGSQEMDNGVGVTDVNRGWTTRDTSPLDVWKFGANGIWKDASDSTRTAVVNAFLNTWLDRSESFDVNTWQRVDQAGGSNTCGWSERRLCWSWYVPGQLALGMTSSVDFPTNVFQQIPQMRTDGVDGGLLNRFAAELGRMYPNGNYASLMH
jgi:hypothetical protein